MRRENRVEEVVAIHGRDPSQKPNLRHRRRTSLHEREDSEERRVSSRQIRYLSDC